MNVFVPFKPKDPKTRLSPLLTETERVEFSYAMLRDVCSAVERTGRDLSVLATQEIGLDYDVEVRPERLSPAVNHVLEREEAPVAVVMADLALASGEALDRLFSRDGDLVVAPGRGGGTNAFVTRSSGFRVDYHGASYLDHLGIAEKMGLDVGVMDSYRLSVDVDEVDDLAEVLIHGRGEAKRYLEERFELVVEEESGGRVGVRRN